MFAIRGFEDTYIGSLTQANNIIFHLSITFQMGHIYSSEHP